MLQTLTLSFNKDISDEGINHMFSAHWRGLTKIYLRCYFNNW